MKYKLMLLDVDGTLVPVGPHTTPTERVRQSIQQAKERIHISIVSGRPIKWLTEIFESLDIITPCIINGGSQIVDPKTKEILWEQLLDKGDVEEILKMVRKDNLSFLVNDGGFEHKNPSHLVDLEKPLALQLTYFDSKLQSDRYLEKLQSLPSITAHKFFSWGKDREYRMEIYVTHKEASKYHAAEKLARILNIETSEMIGVGDARNDVPLLNLCGLRIAMGNADDKLKTIAHYIAPDVDKDGIAHIVEKFILS